jgi:hypothetical protein
LMRASRGCRAVQADAQMPHCHGMSMEQGKQASVAASDSCAPASCKGEVTAIVKSVDQNDTAAGKLPISAVASSADLMANRGPSRATSFAALSRSSEARPLALRPGSSLRI